MAGKNVLKKKGEVKLMTIGTMNHIKFMDRREVNILTSIHSGGMSDTGRADRATREQIIKFDVVKDDNRFMGAVDWSDQMVQYNSFKRKTRKWWKKVFFHFFMLAELNVYLLYKESTAQPLSHRMFRHELAKEVARQIIPPKPSRRTSLQPGDSLLHRLTARHFPSRVPRHAGTVEQPGNKVRPATRLCVVCTTNTGKRKAPGDSRKRK
ncbi:piggyBac transposable element-derived protein 4-like [Aplysia californica]|uniref:PiggyBac transposable element-derived protein 4-like n=1 Tax=Aplysia californica TaxID=6500 RepID=A0ABM0JM44_APLCA|nr:piggyBac transposable element-derived protein 4-like [Aplysia californica]